MLDGRAWAFADRLGATDILPLRFHGLPPREAATRLFHDLDPTLAAALAVGDVLVAGREVGHGAPGPPVARALAVAGIVAVVAETFAEGFAEAVLATGLPALEVDAPAVFRTGQRLRLNVEGGTIANLSSGDRQPVRNLTDELLARLRARLGR